MTTAVRETVELGALTAGERLRVRLALAGLPQYRAAALLEVPAPVLSLAMHGRLSARRTEALDARLAELLNTPGGGVPPTT